MGKAEKQGPREDRDGGEGRLRRLGRSVHGLSLIAKSIAALSVSLLVIATVVLGTGTLRLSETGIELPVEGSASAKAGGAPGRSSLVPAPEHGDVYLFLGPGTVRVCKR